MKRWTKRIALASGIVLLVEALYALLRPVPDLEEFDPSIELGDPEHPTLRVAVLGDSSVTAPGVATAEEIWVRRVAERLAENRHVILRSFAVGGARASDLIARQLPPALDFQPDLVFLSVGANDALKGVPIWRFERQLDHLVSELASAGAAVIQSGVGDLGTIPRLTPPLRHLMSYRALAFDRAHRRVAWRHGSTVVTQRTQDHHIWYEDRGLWAEDLFHVSAAGHERWAGVTLEALQPILDSHGS
ncbi:MAG: SGNH/GDSL hydrolase family protein [Acidimicrobiia bacterium]